jgi:hypothetical protein
MTQSAGRNAGGVNKARNKSAEGTRRDESQRRDTEAKPLDPGTRTDGGAPSAATGKTRR